MKLLAPMKVIEHKKSKSGSDSPTRSNAYDWKSMDFTRRLRQKDWVRFLTYSERVKHLGVNSVFKVYDTLRPSYYSDFELDDNAFAQIVGSCPRVAFPNILSLSIKNMRESWIEHIGFFCHKTLQRISLPNLRFDTELFLEQIISKSPQISILTVPPFWNDHDSESLANKSLPMLFSRLSYLKDCRTYSLSQSALSSLAALTRLRYLRRPGSTVPPHFEGIHRLHFENAFPTLEIFELMGDLEELSLLFSSPGAFRKLVDLTVDQSAARLKGLASFLFAVSQSSPLMRKLTITSKVGRAAIYDANNHITFHNLHPLARFTRLEFFELRHRTVVDVTDSQFVDIFMHCISLKKLLIKQVSVAPEVRKSSLTLGVLVSLAERCPQITHLQIPIDLDTVPPPTLGLPTAFTGLRDLHLDNSPFPWDPSHVTMFLGKVLSVDCDVHGSDRGLNISQSWRYILPSLLQHFEERRAGLRLLPKDDDPAREGRLAFLEEIAALKVALSSSREETAVLRAEAGVAGTAQKEVQDENAALKNRISALQRLVSEQGRALGELLGSTASTEKGVRSRGGRG
ncbi:hypothetical protein DFH11DRAFT_1545306 [Phellopilus nigrolimitatus]|nr:hypothetical protein DFH11DRAFT_1545306 [Phellopilus nigrolimitatus]